MNDAVRVSVVLPVRDGARWLRDAVDSVLAQTLRALELVVVDDGSTDATAAILREYRDARLRIVEQQPLGLVAALTRGLTAGRAPYVARMDADDVSLPDRLERQVAYLDAHASVALVVPGVELVDEDDHALGSVLPPPRDADLRRRLLLRNPITHGAVVMRRDALERAGGYRADFGASEDYDLWRRLARAWQLGSIADVVYRHRLHGGSVTARDTERVARREALRDELWREPALVRAIWGEPDAREARALAREALRRRRPVVAARAWCGHLAARLASAS